MQLEWVCCNLCNSDSHRILFEKGGYDYVKCMDCGFVFINPRPTQSEVEKIYNEDERVSNLYVSNEYMERYFKDHQIQEGYSTTLDLLRKYANVNRLLDIGSGNGALLWVAQQQGIKTYGIELNQKSVDFCQSKGLNVLKSDVLDCSFPNGFFDAITMFSILEHLHDPIQTIRRCETLLRASGLCYVVVPNFGSLTVRVLGRNYSYIGLEHLNYFTIKTLKRLFGSAGFEIVDAKSDGINPYHIIDGLKKKKIKESRSTLKLIKEKDATLRQQITNRNSLKVPKQIAKSILNIFNLGDSVSIIARKKA